MKERTDTERLEWIAKISDFSSEILSDDHHIVWKGMTSFTGETFRDAIDAAMDAEERG